jgi:uncharacterized membrane protein
MAALYCVFSLTLQYTMTTSSYDMVIFDQAVRSYAHLQPGISVIKGDHNGFGPNFSVLGDHFSPIIALLAPFYWIYNGPQTLLVAQAVLLALAIPPLWVYTRRALGGGRMGAAAAYFICVAYALSWPIAEAAYFDFHEAAFAPVLTAVVFERLQAGRWRIAVATMAGLLLVKEDMGFFVVGIGIFLLVQDLLLRQATVPRQRLLAACLIVGGLVVTVVAVYVVIPAFGGRANYYWGYGELGANAQQAIGYMFTHPLATLKILVTPGVKVSTYLWLFAPFLFLSLLSPAVIPVIPLLLERMLGVKFPGWWGLSAHYNSYLVIALIVAAVDGAARLDRWVKKARLSGRLASGAIALTLTGVMAAAAIAVVPRFPLAQMFSPSFYHRTADENVAAQAAAAVPSGVTVAAMNHVGPQLTARDTVLMWDGAATPVFPPWVLASVTKVEFGFHTTADQVKRVQLLEAHGYKVVFDKGGYIVLHAPGVNVKGNSAGK